MASGRLHEPTAHRLSQARRAGDVPHSAVVPVAVALCAAWAVVVAYGAELVATGRGAFEHSLVAIAQGRPATAVLTELGSLAATALLPPLGVLLAAGWAGSLLQAPWSALLRASDRSWTTSATRLGAGGRARRLALGLVVSGAALIVLACVLLSALRGALSASAGDPGFVVRAMGAALGALLAWAALSACFLAVLDVMAQRALHRRGLRMTDTEVADERRRLQADPAVRGEQRRHAAVDHASDALAIRDAQLLLLSAAGQLVAVRHEGTRDAPSVPVVTVSVRGLAAQRLLVQSQREQPPVRDDALAQTLGRVGPGQPVPRHLFAAVAAHLRQRRAA